MNQGHYDASLHLFVDDHNLRTSIGFKRIFPKAEKTQRILVTARPGRATYWGCVMHDKDGRYRLWYQDNVYADLHDLATAGVWGSGTDYGYYPERAQNAVPITQITMVGYAESCDGINWELPALGIIEVNGSKDNNYVLDGSHAAMKTNNCLTNMDSISVVYDEIAPPDKRYNLICHWESIRIYDNLISHLNRPEKDIQLMRKYRAKYLNTSPDGIHWSNELIRIKECAGGGDYCGVVRDERNKMWWFNDRAPTSKILGRRMRTAGLCKSSSLYIWPDTVKQVFPMTEFEDYSVKYEHHGMTPFNYGDQDLCLLEISVGGFPKGVVLGSHRDGGDWQLPNGKEFILETGPIGSIDDIIVLPTRNQPIRIGDKLYIYYTAVSTNGNVDAQNLTWNTTGIEYHLGAARLRKGYSISAAVLRLDGFAGMTVDTVYTSRFYKHAYLETQPFTVTQPELMLNIVHNGSACAALVDEYGNEIPGYGFDDCMPIELDAVRAPVRWKNGQNVQKLLGKKVIVVIRATAGTVYAVKI